MVVVRADVEPGEPIGFVHTGRQHDDRHVRFAAQGTGDRQAVEAWQPEVEHHKVRPALPRHLQAARSVRCHLDREARARQVVTCDGRDLRLIVYDENSGHGGRDRATAARSSRSYVIGA